MKHQYSLQYHRSKYMRHTSHVLTVNLNTLLATCHLQSKFIHEPSYMDMYTCFHFTCSFHPTSKFTLLRTSMETTQCHKFDGWNDFRNTLKPVFNTCNAMKDLCDIVQYKSHCKALISLHSGFTNSNKKNYLLLSPVITRYF